jgi:hypothetical protein
VSLLAQGRKLIVDADRLAAGEREDGRDFRGEDFG